MPYQVRIVHYGDQGFPGPALYHLSRFGEILNIPFYFWVVQGEGRTILIDTGVSSEQAAIESKNTVARFGKECSWNVPPEKDPIKQLGDLGITPDTIDAIIFTHLHPDHSANLPAFPESQLIMARRAWEAIHSPSHPNLIKPGLYPDYVMEELHKELGTRFRLVEDGESIFPGIQCYRVGGHSPDLTVVTVETSEGEVIIASDAAIHYESLESNWPTASFNMADSLYALDFIKGRGGIILPGHDWDTLKRHPTQVIG
jgi:glyoxylase-like metal-dependent hydrolase (beta-lactamase superfamily II)